MRCASCDAVVASADSFCGTCGAKVLKSGNGSSTLPGSRRVFFAHAVGERAGRMSNATRYMCAAAYLVPGFASRVTGELLGTNRAVAPSVGVDLEPVLRHCLRARSMQLTRDAILTLLLLASLYVNLSLTVLLLVVCYFVGFLPSVNWARKSFKAKAAGVAGSALILALAGTAVAVLILVGILEVLKRVASSGLGPDATGAGVAEPSSGPSFPVIWVILVIAIVITQVIYTFKRSKILCSDLAAGSESRAKRLLGARVETRIGQVEGAQYGNLVLYSTENPFVGTGVRTSSWSIAIELRRAGSRNALLTSAAPGLPEVDPVELHEVLRERLLQLDDRSLPENQRLTSLSVDDHIVGPGFNRWDSPLIDQKQLVPYSQASPDAIAALIRTPQAGVRYYQRVSVCDEGQAVWSGSERVIDGVDQGISTSALVYVAVEGHMFYLEFVSAVMPPLHSRLQDVDLLPKISGGSFLTKVVLDALRSSFRDLFYAIVRTARGLTSLAREGRRVSAAEDAARETIYGDVGVRFSVREAASVARYESYIQRLDAQKYTKIVERLVTDSVLDYLTIKGADTSEYVNSALTVVNSGLFVGAGAKVSGPVAFGAGSSIQQGQATSER
jgi:hypothetical protein